MTETELQNQPQSQQFRPHSEQAPPANRRSEWQPLDRLATISDIKVLRTELRSIKIAVWIICGMMLISVALLLFGLAMAFFQFGWVLGM